MKMIYIELTEKQKEKLSPLLDEVAKNSTVEKCVMLLAQIHISGWDATAVCRIVSHEKSKKIQAVFGEKQVGKIADGEHAEKALVKARTA